MKIRHSSLLSQKSNVPIRICKRVASFKGFSALLFSLVCVSNGCAWQENYSFPDDPSSPEYFVTDLGSLGGEHTYPNAINNKTQVVGESVTGNGDRHAFLWEKGKMVDLFPGDALWSSANDINNQGNYVGDIFPRSYQIGHVDGTSHAFSVIDGDLSDDLHLHGFFEIGGNTKGFNGSALRINEENVILGYFAGTSVRWYSNRIAWIEKGIWTAAINDLGELGGHWDGYPRLASKYVPGGMNALPMVGWTSGKVRDIDNEGTCVGYVEVEVEDETNGNTETKVRACMWSRNGPLVLFPFGSRANALNNQGDVVGVGWPLVKAEGGSSAYLWEGEKAIDLNTRIPINSGWHLSRCTDINDSGEIIGIGSFNGEVHGFLLRKPLASVFNVTAQDFWNWSIHLQPSDVPFYLFVGQDNEMQKSPSQLSSIPGATRLGPFTPDRDGGVAVQLPKSFTKERGRLLLQLQEIDSGRLSLVQPFSPEVQRR